MSEFNRIMNIAVSPYYEGVSWYELEERLEAETDQFSDSARSLDAEFKSRVNNALEALE